MKRLSFNECFYSQPFILTEGAIVQRAEREFGITLDKDIMLAGLIYKKKEREILATLYRQYLQIAQNYNLPIILLTNTRRANHERVSQSAFADKHIMKDYSDFLYQIAQEFTCATYIGGMMGCKGDAYSGNDGLSTAEATTFHAWQVDECRNSNIDFLYASIMPTLPEALGIAKAMEASSIPYVISLMIAKNGYLLDGTSIHDAIDTIDKETGIPPICYMTNCVHPTILKEALSNNINKTELVRQRFCGIQANASSLTPEELDASKELKSTSPQELLIDFLSLHKEFPMKIYGGCCGTDNTHINSIAREFHKM